MQVGEEAQLHPPGGELLHLDPQECAKVAHKSWGEPGEASVGLRGQLTSAQHPDLKGQKAPESRGGMPVGGNYREERERPVPTRVRVPHTCTASATPLEELEEDIGGNSPGQGVPRCVLSQQVYYGENESKPTYGPLVPSSGETAPGTSHSFFLPPSSQLCRTVLG